MLDPSDYKTWTALHEHPALENATEYVYRCYVHVQPPPPPESQRAEAERDLKNLGQVCSELEAAFGEIQVELQVLDDYTVFASVRHALFDVDVYPQDRSYDGAILGVWFDRPTTEDDEVRLRSVAELTPLLREMLSDHAG